MDSEANDLGGGQRRTCVSRWIRIGRDQVDVRITRVDDDLPERRPIANEALDEVRVQAVAVERDLRAHPGLARDGIHINIPPRDRREPLDEQLLLQRCHASTHEQHRSIQDDTHEEGRGVRVTVERLGTGEHGGRTTFEVAFERAIGTAAGRVKDRDPAPATYHSLFPVGARHVLEHLEARDDARAGSTAGSDTSSGARGRGDIGARRSAVRWSHGPRRC